MKVLFFSGLITLSLMATQKSDAGEAACNPHFENYGYGVRMTYTTHEFVPFEQTLYGGMNQAFAALVKAEDNDECSQSPKDAQDCDFSFFPWGESVKMSLNHEIITTTGIRSALAIVQKLQAHNVCTLQKVNPPVCDFAEMRFGQSKRLFFQNVLLTTDYKVADVRKQIIALGLCKQNTAE